MFKYLVLDLSSEQTNQPAVTNQPPAFNTHSLVAFVNKNIHKF